MADAMKMPPEGITKTTLGELGFKLPVGTPDGAKDMTCRPWRLKEERELGALRERKKGQLTDFVTSVVGAMFPQLAGSDMEKLGEPERDGRIQRMAMGDVLYAYVILRREALGAAIELKVQCPICRRENRIDADLNDLDVRCCAPDHSWVYALKNPVTMRGEVVQDFTLGLAPWRAMSAIGAGKAGMGNAKAEIIRASIRKVGPKEAITLRVDDLDEMTKIDVEGIAESIDEHSAGPDFAVEVKCSSCESEVRTSLDWGYDSFFSTRSSR